MTDDPRSTALAAIAAIALSGCTLITDSFLTNEFSGDPDPIDIETETGAIVVGLRQADQPDRVAVVDLMSPFTLTDAGRGRPPLVSFVDLTLLGKDPRTLRAGAIDLAEVVPRARMIDAQVIALHPCDDSGDNADGACHIGPRAAPRTFDAIVGADVLAGDAVRLRLGDDKMFVLADVGGSDRGRSLSCDAVFNSPYRGGGTVVIAGTELPFGNRRITVQACLGQDPDAAVMPNQLPIRQHGADALLVASTGIGVTILGRTAYERYIRAADPGVVVPPFDQLAPLEVYMPSGLVVNGRRGTLDRIALVAAASSGNQLAPCRQVYAHRYLMLGNCGTPGQPGDCPCKNGRTFCAVPAIMSLEPDGGVPVLVVPDDDPTLQALRTELRPDQPEVDGVLGTDVLRAAEIDVDYPHDRLVARCAKARCATRPQLSDQVDRRQIQGCLEGQPTGPILPD